MKIYTAQMSVGKKLLKEGWTTDEIIDTTVKSGAVLLAPEWAMVMGIKKGGGLSEEDYTAQYNELMRNRYLEDKTFLNYLFEKERIVLLCYCKAGDFCHRHLLVKILLALSDKFHYDATYCGELTH